jgi:hypothetical protein
MSGSFFRLRLASYVAQIPARKFHGAKKVGRDTLRGYFDATSGRPRDHSRGDSEVTTRHTLTTLTLAAALLTTAAVDPLAYRARNGRWEGVRSGPVSGYDVELLGAMVESEQATAGVPDEMAVLFFLDGQEDVYLTVRERDPLEYYWLDRVVPPKGWRSWPG